GGSDSASDYLPSMGPRSENRGYGLNHLTQLRFRCNLQWVHGPRTVVMWDGRFRGTHADCALQWVHGPRTVVMIVAREVQKALAGPSMGPRSENRGYARGMQPLKNGFSTFNGSTVREPWLWETTTAAF